MHTYSINGWVFLFSFWGNREWKAGKFVFPETKLTGFWLGRFFFGLVSDRFSRFSCAIGPLHATWYKDLDWLDEGRSVRDVFRGIGKSFANFMDKRYRQTMREIAEYGED